VDYGHDFIIEIPMNVQGLVNLGGIESPGLTAAPAISLRIIELLEDGQPWSAAETPTAPPRQRC
jgi:glycerol-3-phosphate dehydrogenase